MLTLAAYKAVDNLPPELVDALIVADDVAASGAAALPPAATGSGLPPEAGEYSEVHRESELAKPTAALLLSLYPHQRAVLFAVFTAVAALCTLSRSMGPQQQKPNVKEQKL